jgi:hypothetical protein
MGVAQTNKGIGKDEGGRMKDEFRRYEFHPSSFRLHPSITVRDGAMRGWLCGVSWPSEFSLCAYVSFYRNSNLPPF